MKSYYASQQLCLVGKAWEVQYYLRKLSAKSAYRKQTLISVLQNRGTNHKKKPAVNF